MNRLIIINSLKTSPAKFWSDVIHIAVLQRTGQAEEYTINNELIVRRLKENSKEKNLEFSNHLDKLILDCSLSDWDGYGAFPIGKSSANQLKKFLNYINDFGLLRDISIDNICLNTHGTLTISIDYKNENFINIEFGESFFTLTAKIETSILAWENINYNANTFSTIKDIIHTNFNG